MSRKPRKFGESGIYHVILRGNNQESLFYDDNDRYFFINKLKKYIAELKIDIYSYCLMGNHVHLLIGKANPYMPLLIKKLACSYVYYFNHKYNRSGHLFQGRYKSEPVETTEYFKTVFRYILQNPEKALICSFRKYKWSSINLLTSEKRQIINIDFIISIFESHSNMNRFIATKNNDLCMEYYTYSISDDDLKSELIRQIFNIDSPLELQNYEINAMCSKIRTLKEIGLGINQISRLTGINKYLIKLA